MSILAGVISVTNMAMPDGQANGFDSQKCPLPHRFVVNESYDLPFEVLPSTAYSCFVVFLQSDLRDKLIQAEVLPSFNYLNVPDQDMDLQDAFLGAIEGYGVALNDLDLRAFPYLLEQDLSKGFLVIQNPLFRFSYSISSVSASFDIINIKSLLFGNIHPVMLAATVDLDSINDKGVLQSLNGTSRKHFLIYGWNDDFLGGGFILRQFTLEEFGHSISYFYGSIGADTERAYCPCLGNLNGVPYVSTVQEFDDENELICKNGDVCSINDSYRILEKPGERRPWIWQSENGTMGKFLDKEGQERDIELGDGNLTEVFSLGPNRRQVNVDSCAYLFLPYALITDVGDKISDYIAAVDCDIKWNVEDFAADCCKKSSASLSPRPS